MSKYNICSALVHAKLEQIDSVKQTLLTQEGVEVHAQTEDGRLIVTIEDENRKKVGERIMGFYEIEGVLSASMIYQFSDDDFNEQESLETKPAQNKPSQDKTILDENTKERMSA